MQQNLIFAVHGFLGSNQDWNLSESLTEKNWIKPSMFAKDSPDIKNFYDYIDQLILTYKLNSQPLLKKIFVGYSLGGRLGLHFLKSYPNLFDHFVFVSTNPGFTEPIEKAKRLQTDQEWSTFILNSPWNTFLEKWNGQTVFDQQALKPVRSETEFDKYKLSQGMDLWSLGRQENFYQLIEQNQKKIRWVVGSKDDKFLAAAENMKQKKILLDYSRIDSGHRILLQNPKALSNLISNLF